MTNLSQTTGSSDWRDQIEGLVRKPEGHVYGKTALSAQEWTALEAKRAEQAQRFGRDTVDDPRRYAPDTRYAATREVSQRPPVATTAAQAALAVEIMHLVPEVPIVVATLIVERLHEAGYRIAKLRTAADLERDGDQQ